MPSEIDWTPFFLEKPEFGVLPADGKIAKKRKVFEFEALLEEVRELWAQGEKRAAKIAVFKGDNRKDNLRKATSARSRIWRWVLTERPLEEWKVFNRLTEGTWGDREIWVQFRGYMTEEEAMKVQEWRTKGWRPGQNTTSEERARYRNILKDFQNRPPEDDLG